MQAVHSGSGVVMTPTERAIYDHYLTGSTRGDLYVYVKRGMTGLPLKGATGNQRAAWKAGRELAHRAKYGSVS